MDTARELFDTLESFKMPDTKGRTPQQQLLDYCQQVLGTVERYYFDYKTKSDPLDPKLSESDRKNLGKGVSGFANSKGGVLIWGIEDGTLAPKPISDVGIFVASLLQLGPLATDPPVPQIDGFWIPSDSGKNEGFGFIYVPESSLPPHRVALAIKDIQNHYFFRSGQDFIIAPHAQLEDWFGRRPHPVLSLITKLKTGGRMSGSAIVRVILGIKNSGRGVAKYPFLSVNVNLPYRISASGIDGKLTLGLPQLSGGPGQCDGSYGASVTRVIHPGIEHEVTSLEGKIQLSARPVDVPDLVIKYIIMAEGVRPVEGEKTVPGTELLAAA